MAKERRAFTDEAVQDTLPNENINLTERHPLDLTSSIGAQEQKKGFFLNPEIGLYLAQTSSAVHEGRRAGYDRDFRLENIDYEAEEQLRTFKNTLALEYRAKSFTNDYINKRQTALSDELNKSDYTEVHRQDILDNFMNNIEKDVSRMYQKGNYFAADQIRGWAQKYYEDNINSAVSSDLKKDADIHSYNQEASYMSAITSTVNNQKCTTDDFNRVVTYSTYRNMMDSTYIKDYEDVKNNNTYYNAAARTMVAGMVSNFKAGLSTADQTIAQLVELGTKYNLKTFTGYRVLNNADKVMIENYGIEYFQKFYGTNAKVLNVTDEELQKTEAGQILLKSGIVDSMRNPDGTIQVIEETWNTAFDEVTNRTIATAINDIKKNKLGALPALTMDAFDQTYGVENIKKGNYANNVALYSTSDEQYEKDFRSSYETYKYVLANSDSDTVKLQRARQFKDQVIYSYGPRQIYKLLEYAQGSGELTPGKGPSKALLDLIDTIETKYIRNNEYIPDEIPELIFNNDGVVSANFNVPAEYMKSLAINGDSEQLIKKAILVEQIKAFRGQVNGLMEGNGAAFARNTPEYSRGMQQVKDAITPNNLLVVNKEKGTVSIRLDECRNAGNQIRTVQEFTNGSTGIYNNALASQDALKEFYVNYSKLGTSAEREQYALAAGVVMNNIGTADVFMSGNYATASRDEKYFLNKAMGYAFLENSEMKKYTDLIAYKSEDSSMPALVSPTLNNISDLARKNPELLKIDHLTDKNFQSSVYNILNKYKVDNKYRESLGLLAASMAASRMKGQAGATGTFDLGDFESVIKANFDSNGLYKFSTGYSTPDGTNGINTQAGYAGYAKEFDNRIKNYTFDKNAKFTPDPDSKKGEITLGSGNKLMYPTPSGKVPFTVVQTTEGNPGQKALEYKSGIVTGAINVASFTDIASNREVQRKFNFFNKDNKGAWTTGKVEMYAQKLLGHMGKEETQRAFLRYMKDPRRGNVDSVLGENVGLANLLANSESKEKITPEMEEQRIRELMSPYGGGMSRAEATKLVKASISQYNCAPDFVKFAMADMSNKNTMSVYHKSMDKPGTYTVGVTKWPLYDYSSNAPSGSGIITSGFGWRKGKWHNGIDVAVAMNTPVRAAMAGKVTFAGWKDGFGNCVIVESPNGVMWLYGHLNSVNKNLVGKQVRANDLQLGLSGNSGHSDGPHIHFEKRVKCKNGDFFSGTPVDPITHKDRNGKYLGKMDDDTKLALQADELFYKGQVTQDSVKKARDMGYYGVTLSDARYIYDNLLPGYQLSEADAKAVGRTLGVDIKADDDWNVQASIVSRLAQAGDIFKESNRFNARIMAMASIFPGTTFKFISAKNNKPTVTGKTLNDIIAMKRKDGLEKYQNGEWEIDNHPSDLDKWLKPFTIA
jgi:hypothetical protein